jgi:uncharacterized protein (TIGR03435 family)
MHADADSCVVSIVRALASFVPLFVAFHPPLAAQPPFAARFEVTSVKANNLPDRESPVQFGCSNGRFVSLGLGLRSALLWAYKIEYFQLPDVRTGLNLDAAHFDIEARAGGAVSEDECRKMVQSLLADRFKLAVHYEVRPIRVYALVIARGGPKMTKVTAEVKDPGIGVMINGRLRNGPSTGYSMAALPSLLGRWTSSDAPVVDRTGLQGFYKISVEITVGSPPGETTDIFTVAQQLGLRAEDRKEPFQVLVIDHLENPDPN